VKGDLHVSDKKVEKALVLSGGSIKGAFQAGAIAHVLEAGFCPDAIYGTSVGSLNGGFLADRAGREAGPAQQIDWPALGSKLEQFWRDNVHSPELIVRERGTLALLWAIARKKFDGLTDTTPLKKLVAKEFKTGNLHASPFAFHACAVELVSGEVVYASNKDPQIVDYIVASTAIPIEMPVKWIGSSPYVDGGAREIAPLGRAIEDGADEIVCIICQPEKLGAAGVNVGSLIQYAMRLMGVITNELANNDVKRFQEVNAWLHDFEQVQNEVQSRVSARSLDEDAAARLEELLAKLKGSWRPIDLTVIRPDKEIVLDLLDFTPQEIDNILKLGRDTAEKVYPRPGAGAP
jgi:NTE family protein